MRIPLTGNKKAGCSLRDCDGDEKWVVMQSGMGKVRAELIKTDRLILRLFSLVDVEDVLLYASDPEWAHYLPVPQPYTRADAEKFVAGQLLQDRKTRLCWAIEHAGSVIGGINIRFDFDNRVGEMGYSIARRFWGKGLTTEAAGAVIDE